MAVQTTSTTVAGLSLISYNMKGHGQDRINYVKSLVNLFDIIIVQEHWYLNCQLQEFQNNFNNAKVMLKSGMTDDELQVGRPFGGCAILYKESLFNSVVPVNSPHKRLIGAVFICDSYKILLMNVYMPCDSQVIDRNFDDTLDEMNQIIQSHPEVDYVIVGGDFNTDMKRSSSYHTRRLVQFCDNEDLFSCSLNLLDTNDFTFESPNGHRSLIDHFLLSNNFADTHSLSCLVRYDGDNLSDHNALSLIVSLPLSVDDHNGIVHNQDVSMPHIVWRKATEENLHNYRSNLHFRLQALNLALNCSSCSDEACCERISHYYNEISSACIASANESIPRTSSRRPIAGWTEQVKPYKDRSIFWHSLWRSNGFPRQGQVYMIMKKAKSDYKRISRKVIRNQEKLKSEKMATCVLNNHDRAFWEEIKRISRSKVQLSKTVEGAHNEETINEIFTEKYNKLYKSVPYNLTNMNTLYQKVCNKLALCPQDDCPSLHDISVAEVRQGVKNMRPHKGDSDFELSSCHIIHGGTALLEHLSCLFSEMIAHGFTPSSMNMSTLVPITKSNKKSASDSSNYRAIALGSVFAKVLDNIIMQKCKRNFRTSDLQFGFKEKSSTTQCTYVLNEIVDLYTRNSSSLHVVLLDASQAFDRVEYCKLFKVLDDRNTCPYITRFLISMYTSQTLRVKWGDTMSNEFSCRNGVKQGGVLSPLLFCLYIDVLFVRLSNSRVGCHFGDHFCGALCYADDLTLLAPSRSSIKLLINICEDFADEFSVKYNPTKSIYLCYNDKLDQNPGLVINNIVVKKSDSAIHLGHLIGPCIQDNFIMQGRTKFVSAFNSMFARFKFCSSNVLSKLFTSYCTSFYGCILWRLDLPIINEFYVTWRKIIRRIWRLSPRTHCNILPHLMNSPNIADQLFQRFKSFHVKSLNSQNFFVRNFTLSLPFSRSSAAFNRRHILSHSHNVNVNNIDDFSTSLCIKELCNIRDNVFSINEQFTNFDVKSMIDLLCTG